MKKIPLEDTFADVIGKAQRGLGLSDSELAEQARISSSDVRKLRAGELDELAIYRVAPVLDLAGRALFDLASGNWTPPDIALPHGAAQFNTTFGDMTVNSYLVWDPQTKRGIAFDTGADAGEMLRMARTEQVKIELILFTHSHPDHIAAFGELRKATGAAAFIGERESVEGAERLPEGKRLTVGALAIDTLLTWGHSEGALTYFVRGLERPLAIAGDSIFAGSMGGGAVSYKDALQNNLEKILVLPNETIICPGHGPLTTVENERQANPFFAAKFTA
ncbi:MAG: MBL fold metallo-hydrolase [Verrucomicrobiota bacterium]|nr:MBL fold metallo-hydrolase [Verrucomicrobiota bacterium]